jgi:hypothetical protein
MNRIFDVRLKCDGRVDRGLSKLPGEEKSENAGKKAGEHASDEQCANHGCRACGRSVAGETEEVTRIVEPLVHVLATNDRCCALLGPDDVQQE